MSHPAPGGASRAETPPPDPKDASTTELITALTDQVTRLVRDEVRLAQAEVTQKAKRYGLGAGLLGGAGLFALLGLNAFVVAAIFGLGYALNNWIAAIVIGVLLFFLAGVLALIGRKDVQSAGSPLPKEAIASVQDDIDTVKKAVSR